MVSRPGTATRIVAGSERADAGARDEERADPAPERPARAQSTT